MALLDLLGRRWMLRVLWELRDRKLTFRELRAACDGMSMSVLNERLGELRAAGLVRQDGTSGYALTDRARELHACLEGLDAWAKRWARTFDGE